MKSYTRGIDLLAEFPDTVSEYDSLDVDILNAGCYTTRFVLDRYAADDDKTIEFVNCIEMHVKNPERRPVTDLFESVSLYVCSRRIDKIWSDRLDVLIELTGRDAVRQQGDWTVVPLPLACTHPGDLLPVNLDFCEVELRFKTSYGLYDTKTRLHGRCFYPRRFPDLFRKLPYSYDKCPEFQFETRGLCRRTGWVSEGTNAFQVCVGSKYSHLCILGIPRENVNAVTCKNGVQTTVPDSIKEGIITFHGDQYGLPGGAKLTIEIQEDDVLRRRGCFETEVYALVHVPMLFTSGIGGIEDGCGRFKNHLVRRDSCSNLYL